MLTVRTVKDNNFIIHWQKPITELCIRSLIQYNRQNICL